MTRRGTRQKPADSSLNNTIDYYSMFGRKRGSRNRSNCPAGLEISIPTPVRDEDPPPAIPSPFRPSPPPRVLVKRLSSSLPPDLAPAQVFPVEEPPLQVASINDDSRSPAASHSSPRGSHFSTTSKEASTLFGLLCSWLTMCQGTAPTFVLSKDNTMHQPTTQQPAQQHGYTSPLLLLAVFWAGVALTCKYVCWVQHNSAAADPAFFQHMLPFCQIGYRPPTTSTTSSMAVTVPMNRKTLVPSNTSDMLRGSVNSQQQQLPKQEAVHSGNSRNSSHSSTSRRSSNPLSFSTLFGVNYEDHVGNAKTAAPTTMDTIECEVKRARHARIRTDDYHLSFTGEVVLTTLERTMIQNVATALRANEAADWVNRTARVPWGGPFATTDKDRAVTQWWCPLYTNSDNSNQQQQSPPRTNSDLDQLDGGHLLHAYLYIMKFQEYVKFPFRLCGAGCPPHVAPLHTLEWREKYQPWMISPKGMQENADGFVYHRGFSPLVDTAAGIHSIVWLRFAHVVQHDVSFFRGILHSIDRAVADSLRASNGQVGKFNVIIDCAGFSLSKSTPSIHGLRQHITMLQDHYPNRVGMIYLAHLSRAGEIFLKVVLRFITKEVREKIKILPSHDSETTQAILQYVVDASYQPDWLGGTDTFRFNAEDYYPPERQFSDEWAEAFLTTMPYHAK